MIRAAFTTLRRWAAEARDWQQDALAEFQRLDAATRQHMQHGAMAGGDPLTDSLYDQMQAAAEEGAQPPTPYAASIQQQRGNSRRWWALAITLLAALLGAALLIPARA